MIRKQIVDYGNKITMKITLVRFRSYVETKVFEFPSLNISLISGISGCGKSTILEAIYWVLYGSMQHIYPTGTTGSSNKQTCVLLELPEAGGVCIRRCKPPETLEVGIPNKDEKGQQSYNVLTGNAAQAHIVSIFGSKGLWTASSYITQGCRSPLVTLSSNDKFQLLHELTFNQDETATVDTPDFYLAKIDEEIEKIKQYLTYQNGAYNASLDTFSKAIVAYQDSFVKWGHREVNKSAVDQLRHEVNELESQLKTQNIAYQTSRDEELRIANIKLDILKTKEQLAALYTKKYPIDKIKEMEVEYKQLQLVTERRKFRNQIREHIDELNRHRTALPVVHQHLGLSAGQIAAHRHRLETYQHQYTMFTTLNVTPETYKDVITSTKLTLSRNEMAIKSYQDWEERVNQLKHEYNKQIAEADAHYQQMYEKWAAGNREIDTRRKQLIERNQLMKDNYEAKLREYSLIQNLSLQHKASSVEYEHLLKTKSDKEAIHTTFMSWWNTQYPENKYSNDIARDKLREAQLRLQELICPHCNQSVVLNGNQLNRGRTLPQDRDTLIVTVNKLSAYTGLNDLTVAINQLNDHKRAMTQLEANLQSLQQNIKVEDTMLKIEEPKYDYVPEHVMAAMPQRQIISSPIYPPEPSKPLTKDVVGRLTMTCSQLEELVVPDISRSEIQAQLASLNAINSHIEYTKQIANLEATLPPASPSPSPPSTTAIYTDLETKLAEQIRYAGQIQVLEGNLKNLETSAAPKHNCMPSTEIKLQIQTTETKLRDNRGLITCGEHVVHLTETKVNLETSQKQLLQYATYEGQLVRIKGIINEVSTNAMDEIVGSINETTNLILRDLFEDEIQVLLATHKTLKTKDKIKLQVNLQILYRGLTYDNPSQLSGGEQDRISLALTLALAKVNGSSILLLDECMASIGAELRERCLKTLRIHMPNKTILHVCHEIVEGQHDSTVRL